MCSSPLLAQGGMGEATDGPLATYPRSRGDRDGVMT